MVATLQGTITCHSYLHHRKVTIVDIFLCSVFLIMSQVTVTTTTTTTPVTVVCSGASPITMTISMASTVVGLPISGQQDVVLLPQLIWRDTMRGFVGLSNMMQ